MMYLTHLECADCSATYEANVEQHRCACGGVLLARYDLERLAREVPRKQIAARSWSAGLWRYAEMLPVERPEDRVTLGEGATPLLPVAWLSAQLGAEVWLKDEGLNPTGSFKALPTAGNAGAAWAAYGAWAGLPVVVAMPKDAPALTQREVELYGARFHLVDGLIGDAGAWVTEGVREHGWYDASAF